jgi:hypothetical protein
MSACAIAAIQVVALPTSGCADRLFYWPSDRVYAEATAYHHNGADVWFHADDGTRLHGWWLPAVGAAKGTVVYCHGNNANITRHAHFVARDGLFGGR